MEFNYHSLSDQTIFEEALLQFKKAGFLLIKNCFTNQELHLLLETSNKLKEFTLEKNTSDPVLRHHFEDMP